MPDQKPEDSYCKAETEAERLRLRTAVLAAYGGHIRVAARRLVAPRYVDEACQAGAVGLLDALEKFDPGRGAPLWALAALYVRNEIQQWKRTGIDWAPAPDRGTGERAAKRAAANERLKAAKSFLSASNPEIERRQVEHLDPEALLSEAERQRAVSEWAAELDPADREIIYCEDGRGIRSRHYLSLVEAARKRLQGNDGSGHSVRSGSDTLRP